MSTPQTFSEAYQAAHQAAAWFHLPQAGVLRIAGATRQDYLQRQTTNDVRLLSPQRVVPSVLTTPNARILEVFTLIQTHDNEAFMLLTQPGHAAGLLAYFKRHLFFNDQVTIEDTSVQWEQVELYGPSHATSLAALGFASSPALDTMVATNLGEHTLYAIGAEGCTRLVLPAALWVSVSDQLACVPALSAEAHELLRIEAGRAGLPEFTDAYTPFEVGLERYISDTKGCYTGQEVLARQVTYDKVTRQLALLAANALPTVGDSVSLNGRTVGNVSSAAVSPTRGSLALAVLRKPFAPGDPAEIAGQPATIL